MKKNTIKYLRLLSGIVNIKNRHQRNAFYKLRREFYRNLWLETADMLRAHVEDIGYGYLKIRKNGRSTYVNCDKVMLDSHLTLKIAGNKPLVFKVLKNNGFRVPRFREFTMNEIAVAHEFMCGINGSVVVKPAQDTGGGRGVTTSITRKNQLLRASFMASAFTEQLLIEGEVPGESYRLTYLGGEFVDAVRRDPPFVIGDGTNNIRKLIAMENDNRLTLKPIRSLSPLEIDIDCKKYLKMQNCDLRYIPEKNAFVTVKSVVNQNTSDNNHIVRDIIDSTVIKAGKKIMKLFNLELGGIDIITPDITVPLEESGGVINEINTTPGFHHHYLVSEKNKIVPIAAKTIEYVLSKNSNLPCSKVDWRASKLGTNANPRCYRDTF